MAETNQAVFQNQLRTLAAGILTVPIADPWVLDGKSYTKAQLAQLILGFISSTDAANAAKVAAKQAVPVQTRTWRRPRRTSRSS